MPDAADQDHLAHLRVEQSGPPDPDAARQMHTMPLRQTDRRPVTGVPVGSESLRAITASVQAEGAWVHILHPDQVLELVAGADHAQPTDAGEGDLAISVERDRSALFAILFGRSDEPRDSERKHRIEDAVRNARAAVEEGLLPGGGVALAYAARTAFDQLHLNGDEATGANIVRIALTAPLKQIATNAGFEGPVVAARVASLPPGHGLNAASGEYVDMVEAGIVEPAKVTRCALQNAASIAAMLLTSEVMVVEKPQ
jgi:hypothetical protein